MIHLVDLPGGFTRARTVEEALAKVRPEAGAYARWAGLELDLSGEIAVVQRAETQAQLADGDTEILLERDLELNPAYLGWLMQLAARSAEAFQRLYDSVPDKDRVDTAKDRNTFYGKAPCTAAEVLSHVDRTAGYYLSRIGIDFSPAAGQLVENRRKSLDLIAHDCRALRNEVVCMDNECWTTAKALRRFIWHDRIHAKALYRFAVRIWGAEKISDAFYFQ